MTVAPPAADLAYAAADRGSGRRVFQETCVVCHGDDGQGGHGGGAPLDRVAGFGAVVETVRDGRNYMSEFGSVRSPEQIRDVAAYVAERFAKHPAS